MLSIIGTHQFRISKGKTESELSFEEEKAALVVVYFHGYYALSDLDEANGLAMILSISYVLGLLLKNDRTDLIKQSSDRSLSWQA
jgi:hypothetical protein